MGQKTIPQLQVGTVIDTSSIFIFDSGTQTYQITSTNVAQGLRPLATPPVIADKTGNYSPAVAQEGGTIGLNSSGGSFNVQLPAPNTMTGKFFNLSDVIGSLEAFPVTLVRAAAELIEGLASDYLLQSDWGNYRVFSNGTNWFVTRGVSKKTFTAGGNFVVPAGVKKIRATSVKYPPNPLSIAGGGATSVSVLDVEGSIWAWGGNANGQLGQNTFGANVSLPTAVINTMSLRKMKQVYQGGGIQFMLDDGGHLYGVGVGNNGNLGDGTLITKSTPVAVLGGMAFKRIWNRNSSGGYIFVQAYNGLTYTWGFNTNGELGVGDTVKRSSPVAVLGNIVFKQVDNALAGIYTIALDEAGNGWAWGANANGNLGVGDVIPRSSPVAVLGSHVFKKVFTRRTGGSSSCAFGLDTAGKLWGWGSNENGQLGDGTVIDKSSPVAVLGNHVFSEVFPGQEQGTWICAVDTAGQLWAWGLNNWGQLGDGTQVDKSSPVAVLGTHKFVKAYHTTECTLAIDDAGAAWAWGRNVAGQHGDGTVNPSSSPVAVLGGHVFEHLAIEGASNISVLGIDTDGNLWAWGDNVSNKGLLGLNDIVNRSSPVAVTGPLGFGPVVKLQPEVATVEISSTPGATLAVVLHANYAKVGRTFLQTGDVDSITLEW